MVRLYPRGCVVGLWATRLTFCFVPNSAVSGACLSSVMLGGAAEALAVAIRPRAARAHAIAGTNGF
jgi:hypothetical protein